MRFVELQLTGFKKYRQRRFVFGDGLNLIQGPNEAGKSTLHQALVTALYGLGKKDDQLFRNKSELYHWSGDEHCELLLKFSRADKHYLITRRIDQSEVALSQLTAEGDVLDVLARDERGVAHFLKHELGIVDPGVFNQTVSVQQDQLAALTDLSSVGEAIESILMGARRRSVDEVLDRLKQLRKRLKKNPREKAGEIDELEVEWQAARTTLLEVRSQAARRREVAEQLEAIEQALPGQKQRLKQLHHLIEQSGQQQELKARRAEKQKQLDQLNTQLEKVRTQQQRYDVAETALNDYPAWRESPQSLTRLTEALGRQAQLEERLNRLNNDETAVASTLKIWIAERKLYLPADVLYVGLGLILLGLVLVWWFEQWLYGAVSLMGLGYGTFSWYRWWKSVHVPEQTRRQERILATESELAAGQQTIQEIQAALQISDALLRDEDRLHTEIERFRARLDAWEKAREGLAVAGADLDLPQLTNEKNTLGVALHALDQELEPLSSLQINPEQLSSWRQEAAELESQIPADEQRLAQLTGQLETLVEQHASPMAAEDRVHYLEERLARLNQRLAAVRLAQETLVQVVDSYRQSYLPELEQLSSRQFERLTHDRYNQLSLVNSWPAIKVGMDDREIEPEQLSRGTRDQAFLALRLAAAEVLSEGHHLPLILDDPFVTFDRERHRQAVEMLIELARERQVIYLTTDRGDDKLIREQAKALDQVVLDRE